MDNVMKPSEMKPRNAPQTFEVPFDVIELPSEGKLYKEGSLAGKSSLEIQYLTAKEEDILTSPNLIQSGKLLDVLLKSVIKDKSVKPSELLLGDRNAIIIWLRATGYGEEYPVQMQCRHCGEKYIANFNLSTFEERKLTEDFDVNGLFSFTFPTSKKTILYKLLAAQDEDDIGLMIEDRKKKTNTKIENTLTLKMKYMIKDVDGITDSGVISQFVDTMSLRDTKAFRKKVYSMEPGLIMEQNCKCSECNEFNLEVMPMRSNFFWPED